MTSSRSFARIGLARRRGPEAARAARPSRASLIKRQICAATRRHHDRLAAGLWIVRLRAPFDPARFPSAASPALRAAARSELDALLAAAAAAARRSAMTSWPQAACWSALVRAYRFALSPWLGSACRFEPTCSALRARGARAHGAARGPHLTLGRIGAAIPGAPAASTRCRRDRRALHRPARARPHAEPSRLPSPTRAHDRYPPHPAVGASSRCRSFCMWDAWNRHTGQPSMFGAARSARRRAGRAGAPSAPRRGRRRRRSRQRSARRRSDAGRTRRACRRARQRRRRRRGAAGHDHDRSSSRRRSTAAAASWCASNC